MANDKDDFIEQILNEKVPIVEQDFVTSSLLKEATYHKLAQSLTVKFKTSPNTYCYYDVPKEIVEEFFVSTSAGNYFNTRIKNIYNWVMIPATKEKKDKI